MPPFACDFKCPEFGKKKKDLSRYHEGKKAGMQTASSLFAFLTVTTQKKIKREDAQKLKALCGRLKSPKSRRAKRIPFPSVRPKQSRKFKRPCCFG